MIRRCAGTDFEAILEVINDGAAIYQGIIPADRWTEPYMSRAHLQGDIGDGVVFWGYANDTGLCAVMGMQAVQDVSLIRHAYVRRRDQGQGIGAQLLGFLKTMAPGPILVGTWADAVWAVRFYQNNGFVLVEPEEKDRLLRRYWKIPERQIETSVVLSARTSSKVPDTLR